MVRILYTKAFLSQFKKLPESIKQDTRIAIEKFRKDPKDKSLKGHKLGGVLKGSFAFSVNYKTRIVFEEDRKEKNTMNFLKIGDHDVYK
jgi:mRNA-degrading endonuclease YafQ of YafQ-DinJ toxin-antitoxin module